MGYDVVRLVYYGLIITSFGKSTNRANLQIEQICEWANGADKQNDGRTSQ